MGYKVKKLGQYNVKAIPVGKGEKLTIGEAGTGSDQMGLQLVATSEGSYQNQIFPCYFALNSAENYERSVKQLVVLGARCKDGNYRDLDGLGKTEGSSMLEESTDEDSGNVTVRWSFVNAIGSVAMKKIHDEAAQAAIYEKYRASGLKAVSGSMGSTPTKKPDDGLAV